MGFLYNIGSRENEIGIEVAMTKIESYIERYVEIELGDYHTFHDRINTRIERFGAYRYLENKNKDEIRQFTHTDIAKIFKGLYSTQRPNVMDSLLEILNVPGGVPF